jgi:hypothetical protein
VLNQLGEHIAQADGLLHLWRVDQLVADLDHLVAIAIGDGFTRLAEHFQVADALV